jgi:hypothetical protein
MHLSLGVTVVETDVGIRDVDRTKDIYEFEVFRTGNAIEG